ncbi:metabolite traffic protein EboE [Mucilaginibacter sp.]|uniref:metabolite traffic protein EboE n=1 Tax=Mucilaginibacter sp. TaxID=1882438 RepID=UPI00261559FE|nr:metabolite traffic protein EboE [Mucilaginibacter sp.]MDB4925042.1 xylose isomerase [Mucilaginibacter sp.]
MQLASGHLTYCTNIHAGETWSKHFAALKENFPAIKTRVSPDKPMGIGLRLSNKASLDLQKAENLLLFTQWLKENDAYVFTMNGFPYGEFHHTVVKDQVHAPDWTTKLRVDYTIRMFHILAALLPKGMEGGISTSPLSYKYWHKTEQELQKVKNEATSNILLVAGELIRLRRATGIIMHLDIEPEPDGVLETGKEYITWYKDVLLPLGRESIAKRFNISADEAEQLIKDHITLCYDVCHFAIGYEPHHEVINELAAKGLKVGKIQISAALKATLPQDAELREPIRDAFARFDESTYLHQVVAKKINGKLLRYPDLPEALADIENVTVKQWRAHFHVPIFTEEFGLVQSTQADIVKVLDIHKSALFTNHLEVETYTWGVLPDEKKLPLNDSIIRELNWVKDQL